MRGWLLAGALLGLGSVALGAFGAHGLESELKSAGQDAATVTGRLANWEVAARYQMYHALAILAAGLIAGRTPSRLLHAAAGAFLLGTTVFSGCLYGYVLSGYRPLALVVPIGGVLLLVGWALLATAVTTARQDPCRASIAQRAASETSSCAHSD